VVLLQGSKEGIFHFTSVFIDPGDVVLVPDPGYITYTRSALYSGGEPVPLPLQANDGYLPDLYAIPQNVLRRTKLLWLNYPSNPTAATAPLEFLIQAVEFARKNQLLLCHDAAYTQVTFDGYRAHSIFEVPGAMDTAVEFNSLSKSHNLAGWRIGALVGNASVLNSYFNLKTNADSSHFLPIMEGAAAAMSGDQAWLVERNAVYQNRRDCVVLALRSMGLTVPFPRASLYVWCPIPEGWDSIRFVNEALENAKVSLTPGIIFGQQGEGFVRISLTAPLERLSEAMERLSRAFGKAG
jgi:LL-diaminopimelate aminotransferase